MAPSSQETNVSISSSQSRNVLTGEEVVISGISGLFPNSKNVLEFTENLYNKVDMITKDETKFNHADLPQCSGKISEIEKFDAQFFRVTHKQADSLEPLGRKLMEQAYCAMFDAGINPNLCKGKKIGVFTSAMQIGNILDSNKATNKNNFIISGASKCMLANRISYWLDATGPSYSIDSPSGNMIELENALTCIKTGVCDAAIVGCGELINDSVVAVNMRNAGLLCLDGKTRCFDKNGDGCAKSQAVVVLFLQKAKDAKRIYAEVCVAGLEYGLKEGGEFVQKREPKDVVNFLKDLYDNSGVPPSEIEYVEAHGAANPKADTNELEAIGEVFGKEKPVMVGCVKSNMGDSLPASGLCAVTKICLAYHKGILAGNLHYNDPLEISAIQDGKVEVLTDNTPFNRGFTAINNFSHNGTNSHIILKGHYKPKDPNNYKSDIPHLVLISGRHEQGIEKVINTLKSQSVDPELIGLLHDFYQMEIPGFTCRGYTILDTKDEQTISLSQSTEYYQGAVPPLWFLYSGMGSQWAGMGTELMRIPIFAAAIEKCCKILEPKGVDIVQILTSPDETIFDNVLNCFVGIAAVQIGLTNLLKELGLVADNIIGHSLGENGCAYYDGCFNDEEMILTAYFRGLVSIQTKLIKGSMAAVGLGYKDMLPLCPSEIEIACHNSSECCTISGPEENVKAFVAELTAKGIFAKEVQCGNIAYHSRYIQEAGPGFLMYMKEIITNPVKRGKKWISTSWPDNQRDEQIAELCSAEYHTNNLLSPVYFEEAARLIPHNAVVVEIAPHGLMQAILKKSHPKCTHIPLTKRGHSDPIKFLFEAFGKLYQNGFNLKVDLMYPKIVYPVSTVTPLLSPLVEFYHEENWFSFSHQKKPNDVRTVASRKLAISILDDEYGFLAGHRRGEDIVLPEAAVIFYVWETLAMYMGVDYKEISVVFHDVHFYAEVVIDLEENLHLKFTINKGNNYFEVTRDNVMIANGYVETFTPKTEEISKKSMITEEKDYCDSSLKNSDNKTEIDLDLSCDDIYKIFKLKGYRYQNDFKSIISSSFDWNSTKIKMNGNWITFLDSLIQLNILKRNYDGVSVPKIIKGLTIDMKDHFLSKMSESMLDAQLDTDSGKTICGGVKFNDMIFNDKPIVESEPNVLETWSFISHPQLLDETEEFELISAKSGDIDSLKWVEVQNKIDNDKFVKVFFAAPSMRDVENAVGIVEGGRKFGMDFSGMDNNGNRVMGLVAEGALASTVKLDHDYLLWPVPKHWSLEEAASVPLPYVHACYCLTIKGHLKPGESVFITGGAGALGQAVISICLSLRCTVYTSVQSEQKKRFLLRLFPDLKENNIGVSHGVDFYNMVVCNSKKKRCSLVINCATGLVRELVMKYVSFNGQFLDVSDYDMRQNKQFGMTFLQGCKSYTTINLSNIFRAENVAERKLIHKIISEGIANGMVRPISHVVFPAEDVNRAFRFMSLSRHRGRALIQIRNSVTPIYTPNVMRRITYSSKGVYFIVCDETELGIQLATHLVNRGARKLIINLESKKALGFIEIQLAKWKEMGAIVTISTKKLESKQSCEEILRAVKKLHGIFLIKPKARDNSEHSNNLFSSVVVNLDALSRNNYPDLRHFVIFARTSKNDTEKKLGSALEEICASRVKMGLPTLFIHSELLEDIKLDEKHSEIRPITVETALRGLEISLKQNYTNVLAYNKKRKINKVLKLVAEIIGVKNMDTIDENLCVKDLVGTEVNIEELKFFIKENIKFDLSTEYIKEMTICSLKNLCKFITKARTQFDSALGAFYRFVDKDEIKATEIFVPMLTLSSLADGIQNLNEKATNIMMIPGFEGHHRIFEHICESLKIRATTLQLVPDYSNESIQSIAFDLKERIKDRFILEPKFYVLGYSFGVNVALELAALLEQDGLVGVVYCLDSSPDALRVQLDAYLGEMSEAQLQNAVIKHLFNIMSGSNSKHLEEYIDETNEWNEKVKICVEKLKDFTKYSNEYKRDIIETFYKRICLARKYDPELRLESNIVLLKGISHPKSKSLPLDYGLSKYSKNFVKVCDIKSDVASAPFDCRVTNIINQFLDPALLEELRVKNLCESCFVN